MFVVNAQDTHRQDSPLPNHHSTGCAATLWLSPNLTRNKTRSAFSPEVFPVFKRHLKIVPTAAVLPTARNPVQSLLLPFPPSLKYSWSQPQITRIYRIPVLLERQIRAEGGTARGKSRPVLGLNCAVTPKDQLPPCSPEVLPEHCLWPFAPLTVSSALPPASSSPPASAAPAAK